MCILDMIYLYVSHALCGKLPPCTDKCPSTIVTTYIVPRINVRRQSCSGINNCNVRHGSVSGIYTIWYRLKHMYSISAIIDPLAWYAVLLYQYKSTLYRDSAVLIIAINGNNIRGWQLCERHTGNLCSNLLLEVMRSTCS